MNEHAYAFQICGSGYRESETTELSETRRELAKGRKSMT
jgi:hypothetical protein